MLKRTMRWGLTSLAIGSIVGAAASFGPTSAGASSSSTIKVGIVEDLSGASSVLGVPEYHGAQLAVNEINKAGGIKALGGAKLKLMPFDTASNPDNGITEAQAAVSAGVTAVIGGENSDTVQAGSNVTERAGIPWLNTGGTANSILARGYTGIFTIDFDTTQFAQGWLSAVRKAASAQGIKSPTLVLPYSESSYGSEFLGELKKLVHGSTSIKSSFSYPVTTTNFSTVAARAVNGGGSAILNLGYPNDGVSLATLFGSQSKPGAATKVVGTAGTACGQLSSLGKEADGTLCLFTLSPGSKGTTPYYDAQYKAFQAKFGTIPTEWNGFTAVKFLVAALQKAKSTKGSALDSALHHVKLTAANGDIYAQPMSFQKSGAITYWPVIVGQIQNGAITSVFPQTFASAAILPYGG
jgi:branched-chain amino acid transport system substrate-binding protein